MADIFSDIESALDAHLGTLPSSPAIAWPNRRYDPRQDTPYLQPFLLPSDTGQAALGASGLDKHIGVYQISIFVPLLTGKKAGKDLSDAIANHFARGTKLVYNTATVRITTVKTGQGRRDTTHWHIPIDINYETYSEAR